MREIQEIACGTIKIYSSLNHYRYDGKFDFGEKHMSTAQQFKELLHAVV